MTRATRELKGFAASPGIAIGQAFLYHAEDYCVLKHPVGPDRIEEELRRFEAALAQTREELRALQQKVSREIGEEHAGIFVAHLQLVEDPLLVERSREMVRRERCNIEYAFNQSVHKLAHMIEALEDPILRERSHDVHDVGRRVITHLMGRERETLKGIDRPVILVATDLTPSDTATLPRDKVLAFVTDVGGRTSHTAIMAQALEIPAVVGVHDGTAIIADDEVIIVDGVRGHVLVRPDAHTLRQYERERERLLTETHELEKLRDIPAVTRDRVTAELMANIELPEEIALVKKHGGRGVGLFRTEMLYLNRPELPGEEEQFVAYRRVLEEVAPWPVVIRTLDIGGDKLLKGESDLAKESQFGLRAIRLCLAQPELFKVQLRALLRASAYGNLRIMFPMVSTVDEVRRAKALLSGVRRELRKAGKRVKAHIPVGVMVEVPSTLFSLDLLAKEVDFVSIGTNDLFQYLFAVDRTHESLSWLYDPLQPAMLRALHYLFESARKLRLPVGMCGEMAGDPQATLLLFGLGLRGFSMAPGRIPMVKKLIRQVRLREAQALARRVTRCETAEDVRRLVPRLHEVL